MNKISHQNIRTNTQLGGGVGGRGADIITSGWSNNIIIKESRKIRYQIKCTYFIDHAM